MGEYNGWDEFLQIPVSLNREKQVDMMDVWNMTPSTK